MGGLFSSPDPAPIIAPVTDNSAEVKEAARLEAERLKKRRGLASTILTGPGGITEDASTLKATLG